ncbi:MAG: GNAT family N-acetyltransferase [Actinomycetaceae bacterium]|nr:GNAT family N-acetyltransferase [Actinomycetaceae bacterium]
MSYRLTPIDAEQMRIVAAGVVPLPVEQSAAWDNYDQALEHPNIGRYLFSINDKPVALVSLSLYRMRFVPFLWAKRGPVWLRSQTPENEHALRQALAAEIRKRFPKIPFIRLHAHYSHPQLKDLLQYLSYDETVEVDTCGGDEEKILNSMSKDGRRSIRKAITSMAQKGATAEELTGINYRAFEDLYEVLVETAERDGFRIHPISTYWTMLNSLGPQHARVFGVRYRDEIVTWVIVLINDKKAYAYYGAHSALGRQVYASRYLDYWIAKTLGEEGILSYDLMGVDSTRFPNLHKLGIYKRDFAKNSIQIDGAWDYPIRPLAYRTLQKVVKTKRNVKNLLSRANRK